MQQEGGTSGRVSAGVGRGIGRRGDIASALAPAKSKTPSRVGGFRPARFRGGRGGLVGLVVSDAPGGIHEPINPTCGGTVTLWQKCHCGKNATPCPACHCGKNVTVAARQHCGHTATQPARCQAPHGCSSVATLWRAGNTQESASNRPILEILLRGIGRMLRGVTFELACAGPWVACRLPGFARPACARSSSAPAALWCRPISMGRLIGRYGETRARGIFFHADCPPLQPRLPGLFAYCRFIGRRLPINAPVSD